MFNRKKTPTPIISTHTASIFDPYHGLLKTESDEEKSIRLSKQIAQLTATKETLIENKELSEENDQLKRDIAQNEIKLGKQNEDHQRRIRDIEHKVGLVKQEQEQTLELSKRETKLEVGESNLSKERELFEERIKSFDSQIAFLTGHVEQILGLVPSVDLTASVVPVKTTRK
jgi:chromosome segregation ATPase